MDELNLIMPTNPPNIDSMTDQDVMTRVLAWRALNERYLGFVSEVHGGPEYQPLLAVFQRTPENIREELAVYQRYGLTAANNSFLQQMACETARPHIRSVLELLNEPITYENVLISIRVPSIMVSRTSYQRKANTGLNSGDYLVTVRTQDGTVIVEDMPPTEMYTIDD